MSNEQQNNPSQCRRHDLPQWVVAHLAGVDIGTKLLHEHLDAVLQALIDENQMLKQQIKQLKQQLEDIHQAREAAEVRAHNSNLP